MTHWKRRDGELDDPADKGDDERPVVVCLGEVMMFCAEEVQNDGIDNNYRAVNISQKQHCNVKATTTRMQC